MMKRWLPLCMLVIIALAGCHKRTGLQVGDPMPGATLNDIHGQTLRLPEDFKGKVVLVRFWSIDCGFCDKEILPVLDSFYQKYKNQGFIPIAINESRIAPGDERLKRFAHLQYPMLIDEYGLVARQFGVIGLPTTFVFDEEGILREKLTGEAKAEEFEKLFTTVLNKGGFYESAY